MSLHSLQSAAQKHWAKTDEILANLSKATPLGNDPPRLASDGFGTLVLSIVHQQVSMAAAKTIGDRLVKTLGGKLTPRRILNRNPDELRAAGLSRNKASFILDLADKTQRKDVDFARFAGMTDAQILADLTAVKGIGDWTAKMFLMFHLQRPDVLAFEDLGLRMAVAEVYGIPPEKATAMMQKQQAAWSPYCSVAARVLWQSRRVVPPQNPPHAVRARRKAPT